MLTLLQIILLAIRISGTPSPTGGGAYAPLAPVAPTTLCAAEWGDAGIRKDEPAGAAWQPGSTQTADCYSKELNVR